MSIQTKLITYDDYRNLPNDGKQYEIIEGELFMTAASNTRHNRISHNLECELEYYIRHNASGEIFDAPMDVVLSMTDVVQPDLMYISKKRSQIIAEKNIVGAPDLVVEIISEGTKTTDQTSKKTLYEKHGVKEYWILYPNEKQIEQFILQGAAFKLRSTLKESEMLESVVIDGFTLSLKEIFAF